MRLEDVAARYVPSLRRVGDRLVGVCPFHDDTDPSLNIWPASQSWYCFGACGAGGDVLDFLERAEGIGFSEALARLEEEAGPVGSGAAARAHETKSEWAAVTPPQRRDQPLDAEDHAILNATAEVYYRTLMANPLWQQWIQRRGVSVATMHHFHLGYASGRRLIDYLRWRRLSLEKAQRLGLHHRGLEHLRYRIIVPTMQDWRTPFLIGRATRQGQKPKYLGLARPKLPLVDISHAGPKKAAIIVEGPFDLLVLHEWGYHQQFDLVSLLGTRFKRCWLAGFQGYERVLIATDQDDAGEGAAADLTVLFPGRARRVIWPARFQDIGALGQMREGRAILSAAVESATRTLPEKRAGRVRGPLDSRAPASVSGPEQKSQPG